MRARGLVVAVLILSSVVGCIAEVEPVGSQTEALRDLSGVELEFLERLNEYRAANGVGIISHDSALADAAFAFSERMGNEGFFSHTAPDGSTFDQRMCDAGYRPACGPTTAIGENIAAGQRTAAEVMSSWQGSPPHNGAMLSPDFIVIGIGRANVTSSREKYFWTLDFGGRETMNTVRYVPGATPPPSGTPPPVGGGDVDGGCAVTGSAPVGGSAPLWVAAAIGIGLLARRRRR